ncbi:MAG: Ltp family lipoprotein [Actinobacteria bacterium]|nr:Ltp family lipoprotein [Actinomycetota bacterium]
MLGVDRFYLGKIGTGLLKLVTFGGLGIWWLVDIILTLAGAQRDKKGLKLAGYDQHKKIAWIVTAALLVLGLIVNAVTPRQPGPATAPESLVQAPSAQSPSENSAPEDEPGIADEPTADSEPETAEEPAVEEDPEEAPKPAVPAEYLSALTKADSYANMMYMSKAGVYDQLVSKYGEKFSKKAAKYAIRHVVADWNQNALEKARTYQDDMAMSPDAIYDQLISSYGEKFTSKQAAYAIKHLND